MFAIGTKLTRFTLAFEEVDRKVAAFSVGNGQIVNNQNRGVKHTSAISNLIRPMDSPSAIAKYEVRVG